MHLNTKTKEETQNENSTNKENHPGHTLGHNALE